MATSRVLAALLTREYLDWGRGTSWTRGGEVVSATMLCDVLLLLLAI